MMTRSSASLTGSAAFDSVLDSILDDFAAKLERGAEPRIEDYLQRCPERADELRELLAAVEVMARLESPADAEPSPLLGVRDLGDFRILREVGRGGMGVVYEAEQLSLGRRVALKVLPFATVLDSRHLQRFKNEARAAATLDHPHIVHVHSVGQERGVHYYAMQLIDGQSLAELLTELQQAISPQASGTPTVTMRSPLGARDGSPVSRDTEQNSLPTHTPASSCKRSTAWSGHGRDYYRQVARWGIQAAEALEHAHQLGIVHRDIKPSNLLVNAEGHLWVTDFGLAMTQADAGLTMTGELLGTLRYMSPEQALGRRSVVDQRSDVYSLGITLYELLSLRPAFEHTNRAELLRRIEQHDPAPLRQVIRSIPTELDTIVFKAITKDPDSRYVTALDLADDLRRYLENQPIRARTPTWCDRAVKWSRRNKGPLAAASIVLIVLLAGIVGTTWGLVRSERARQAEVDQRRLANDSERRALAAAAAEKQAREQVQAREAETEAVLRFVQDKVFSAIRPRGQDGGLGPDVTLQEALRSALPHFNAEFANQPRAEARLRKEMGMSFWAIVDYRAAAEQFERAFPLYIEHFGDRHPDSLDTARWLVNIYNKLGRHSEAAQIGEQALTLARTHLDPHDNVTCDIRRNLAESYVGLGRPAEGLILTEENLSSYRVRFGPESYEVKECLARVGWHYCCLGKHAEAVELLEQSLAAKKERHGPNHHATQYGRNVLSDCYSVLGRVDAAISLREEALEAAKSMYGAQHLSTARSRSRLADSYQRAGRRDEAIQLREEVLALPLDKIRSEDWEFREATARRLIADYVAVGRHAEAVKRHEDLLELHESSPDSDDRTTALHRNNLAWHLATCPDPALRDPARAVSLATQAVELSPTSGTYWNTLGAAQYRAGNCTASLDAFGKSMELRDGGDSFDWFFVAMDYWQLGDEPRAREIYRKGVAWMQTNRPNDPELIGFKAECEELFPIEAVVSPESGSR